MLLPTSVKEILSRLQAAGYQGYAVGGCVRDALLGREPCDWDICTDALPGEVHSLFAQERILDVGLAHGTVTLLWQGRPYEITTFRQEGDYSDHRHPDKVQFVSALEQDLARRDFTINAMAVGLDGTVQDFFGGRADLAAGLLRCVGEARERFSEDALRILRALRFAATLDLRIEEKTAQAAMDCRELLACVSPERVYGELNRLLPGPAAARVLGEFTPVLGVILPEILPSVGFQQHNPAHSQDVWSHILTTLSYSGGDRLLRWALLLHDLGKPRSFTLDEQGIGHFKKHPIYSRELAEGIFRRLHADQDTRVRVCRLVLYHDAPPPQTAEELLPWLREFGLEDLQRLAELRRCDGAAHTNAPIMGPIRESTRVFTRELERISRLHGAGKLPLSVKELDISGRELLAMGLQGRAVGQGLERLLRAVVAGDCPNERAALLAYAHAELRGKT